MPNFVTSTPHYNRRALEEYRFQLKSNKTNGKRRKIGAILDVGRLNLGAGRANERAWFLFTNIRGARVNFFFYFRSRIQARAQS